MQPNGFYEQMRIRLKPQSFTSGRPQEDRDTLSSHMTNKNLIPSPANRLPKSSATSPRDYQPLPGTPAARTGDGESI